MRGNVFDLAVGVVIGAAFGRIVTALVDNIIMPPLGILISGVNFSDLGITLRRATEDSEAVVLSYGAFIDAIIQFLIVALAIFFIVRQINRFQKKEEEKQEQGEVQPPQDIRLLTEIRDLLKKE